MILSCNHISKSYGVDTILDDCSFFVNDGEKAAIVGNNGAGKSTIMKIIMGELSADNGTITLGKNKTIGYLAQYQDLASHNSIYDEVKSVKADIINMEKNLLNMKRQCPVFQVMNFTNLWKITLIWNIAFNYLMVIHTKVKSKVLLKV